MKKVWSLLVVVLCSVVVIAGCSSSGGKGAYPNKSVEFIIPFNAGGSSDLMVRAMEKQFTDVFGKSLTITNTGGAGGILGWNDLGDKTADGYTIGSANTSMLLQPLYGGTKYDYIEAFEPIALAATIPIVIAVQASSPFETIEDLIEHAKANPGTLTYAHAGLGSITHVTAELFALEAGIQMEQVPFAGGGPALTALLGGHVDLISGNTGEFKAQIQDGAMRALAITQEHRIEDEVFKDVPTLMEKGFDVNLQVWQGVGAPKGLPDDVKKTLDEGFGKIINDPAFIASVEDIGMNVNYLNAEEFGKLWESQRAVFKQVVESSGILELIQSQKN